MNQFPPRRDSANRENGDTKAFPCQNFRHLSISIGIYMRRVRYIRYVTAFAPLVASDSGAKTLMLYFYNCREVTGIYI